MQLAFAIAKDFLLPKFREFAIPAKRRGARSTTATRLVDYFVKSLLHSPSMLEWKVARRVRTPENKAKFCVSSVAIAPDAHRATVASHPERFRAGRRSFLTDGFR